MSNDITQTITRIAEIIINELKLVDVTPEGFYPEKLTHKVYRYGLALTLPLRECSE